MLNDASTLYTPSYSGGSWVAGLPLTNLSDRRVHKVARSTNDTRSSTLFTCDLGVARDVRCLALVGHNFSAVAPTDTGSGVSEVRVRGFSAPPLIDAGGDGYRPFTFDWTEVGTPTRTPNDFECGDGVFLDLIGDDDGASAEYYHRAVSFTGNGVKTFRFRMARNSAYNGHIIGIYDATGTTYVGSVSVNYTSATPIVSATTGSVLSATDRGDGSYEVVVATVSVTATNTFEFRVFPAGAASADTASFYCGDLQAFDAATDPLVYDTGMTAALPSGTTLETREGYTPTWAHITAENESARYWRFNINDDNNPDTYVEIGRLVIAGGFQPSVNMSYGAGMGFDPGDDARENTIGGATVYDARRVRRTFVGSLERMTEAEAFDDWQAIQMRHGRTRQLFVAYDPDDTTRLWKRSFLGVFRELNAIEHPFHAIHSGGFSIIEDL